MTTTASRLLRLLSLLQNPGRWSGPELAERLGISLRTLRRDIEDLRRSGYPVHASGGRASAYSLGGSTDLPPLLLDDEQAVAVAVGLQSSPGALLGLRDASERALRTLTGGMPPAMRAQADALRVTHIRNYWDFAADPIRADAVAPVGTAVRRREVLRFERLRADGSRPDPADRDFVPPLRVEGHHLVLWAGRWYLLAFHPDDDRWRVHRIDRMHSPASTGVAFTPREPPPGGVADFVMDSTDRDDVLADWQCRGTATLALPPAVVARYAPGGAVVEALGEQRARITLGAWSWAGIAGILATFDAELHDVEPAALRDAARALAGRFASI